MKPTMKQGGIFCCLIIVCSFTLLPHISRGEMSTSYENIRILNPNDVGIAPNAIRIPLGSIWLVRKNTEYCAIKFSEFWTGKNPQDEFASYESYYQGEGTGKFSGSKIKTKKEKLSSPSPRGIGRLAFSFGNRDIKCGSLKLEWSGKGWVYFFNSSQKQGDYGVELAPTKWTDISQVNVFDPRLEWYKYDERRKEEIFPLNLLWEGKKVKNK